MASIAQGYFDELKPLMAVHQSYKLHLFGNLVGIMQYTALNNYEETIKVCNQAIQVFFGKTYLPKVGISIFLHQKIVSLVQLRLYKEGEVAALKCLELLDEGTSNWFKTRELYVLLLLHAKKYNEAYNLWIRTCQHRRYRYIPDQSKEIWRIFGAYLYFLRKANQLNKQDLIQSSKHFKIGKFLNEVPIFSTDKRGFNISILIVQILILIIQKKYDATLDRIGAIEKYCARHLRQNDTFRSNCFIKMLIQIPKANFHKTATLRKAKKYESRLKEVPLTAAQQSFELEIIPYEDVWSFIINSLDKKWH